MNTVRSLHDEAMRLSQMALVARETGEQTNAIEYARRAYELEPEAASLVPDGKESEPTRSILYRSAASLAFQCKEFRAAQQLIAKGLSGYPPMRVERELKTLFEQVSFELNLQTHGLRLADEEVRMILKGNAIGSGNILYNEFLKRADAIFALVDRTAQRKMDVPYRRSGRVPKAYRPYTHVLSAFESGSFVVTLRLGEPEDQQRSLLLNTSEVIQDVLDGITFVNDSQEDRLRQMIPSEEYFRNFIVLARELAPDGEQVDSVVFANATQRVSLVRVKKEMAFFQAQPALVDGQGQRRFITLAGILDHATSRGGDMIGFTDEDGNQYDIRINEGLDDIVRSYFKKPVIVAGFIDGRTIEPTDLKYGDDL